MAEKLTQLCDKFWEKYMDVNPQFCTYVGTDSHSDRLDSYSPSTFTQRKEYFDALLAEAQDIPPDTLDDPLERLNLRIFTYYMQTCAEGLKYGHHQLPVSYDSGPYMSFLSYTVARMPFKTQQDYGTYCRRLQAFPQQIHEVIQLMRMGMEAGVVYHRTSVEGVSAGLDAVITCKPEDNALYKPFTQIPFTFPQEQRVMYSKRGKQMVERYIIEPLLDLSNFIASEYLMCCRPELSIQTLADGTERYLAMLRYHCDVTDIGPEGLHEMGRKEIASIQDKIRDVMVRIDYSGSRSDFADYLKERDDLYFKTEPGQSPVLEHKKKKRWSLSARHKPSPADLDRHQSANDRQEATSSELMKYCENLLNERIRPKLGKAFHETPQIPISFRAVSSERMLSTAIYTGPQPGEAPEGILWVCSQVETVAKYSLLCIVLHETEPGRHFQVSHIKGENSLPKYRRFKDIRNLTEVPGCIPANYCHTKGWGCYCEELGVELNIYSDPYEEYGYLLGSLQRAIRLVVDTGIHAMGWSHVFASSFMKDNGPYTVDQINSEIRRCATFPASGCADTYGHLKIREYRQKAEHELGDMFDVRDFHEECLRHGQVPMHILGNIIDTYICDARENKYHFIDS